MKPTMKPTMKKINEILDTTNGVFTIFQNFFEDDLNFLFNDTDHKELNKIFLFFYGARIIRKSFENYENIVEAVKYICNSNITKWIKEKNILDTEINITNETVEVEEKKGTLNRASDTDTINTNAQKAFNDTDFVDDEKGTTKNVGNVEDTYNLTTTRTKQGNFPERAQSILYLQNKHNLQNKIMLTFANYLTLDIY